MKKFKFQLTALLKVTTMKKEQAEIKFAEAGQRVQAEKAALKNLELEEADNIKAYYEMAGNSIKASDLLLYSNYFDGLKERKRCQVAAIAEAEQHYQVCLEALRAAMSKLKTIEQLREKRLSQYKLDMLAEEQKELDEIGLNIYTRIVR